MSKRGLGRGLAALMGQDARMSGEVEQVELEEIAPNPYQPRTQFDEAAMEELVLSIREHGVLQPVLLHKTTEGKYQIVAGERRVKAAKQAGLGVIPALVKNYSEREMIETAIIENVQRENITAIEAAKAYQRMVEEFGMTQEVISERVGKSRSAISNLLRLLKLPEQIQQWIEKGELSEGHGRALLMVNSVEDMVKLGALVKQRSLSVRDTERMAREANSTASSGQPLYGIVDNLHTTPVEVIPLLCTKPFQGRLVEDLEQILQTRVALKWPGSGMGKIEIEFYSDEELLRISDILLTMRV